MSPPIPPYHLARHVIPFTSSDNLVSGEERMLFNNVSWGEAVIALTPSDSPAVRVRNIQLSSLVVSGYWFYVAAHGFLCYSLLAGEMSVEGETLSLLRCLSRAKGKLSVIVSVSKWDDIRSVGGQMYWKPDKIRSICRDVQARNSVIIGQSQLVLSQSLENLTQALPQFPKLEELNPNAEFKCAARKELVPE